MLHTIICGMDAHDNTLTNRIGVDREVAETMTVRNTQEGREKLFRHLKSLAKEHEGARIVVSYEASPLGFRIYDECVAAGIACQILAPTKMSKAMRERKRKHDKADAQRIFELLKGHVLAGNDLPDIWVPDHQTRDEREIVRSRLDAGEKLTAVEALVVQIKGVGLLTAMVLLTEIGDMRRFSNRRQVGSSLGLASTCRESGEESDRKGHITREGPARVRKALCQATWVRTIYDVVEARVYERILEKNPKHKKIAIVACMRRLGILMWHLAKSLQIKAGVFEDAQNGTAYAQTA